MTETTVASGYPAAFLDRDGVINVDVGYPHLIETFRFIPGAPEAIKALNDAGYRVVVVSNQSGVARGLFTEEAVRVFNQHIAHSLASFGAKIDAFYFCPYHPEAAVERYRVDHHERKPRPGMIERAASEMTLDLTRSFLIGDRETDILAASAAGIPGYLFKENNLFSFVEGHGLSTPPQHV
ncbi:D-glycero-alpha-D-manno-heptose-1,7-bisphosphate 7-phosphatase [Neokomagataea thailandica]|uniref:D,D-heptose 1,7-bisphosphate phosphatase n=1 Tax=Neokomagataea tanensis NBRC 106556 TaxID=1223519 RepID=A0ABQ0QLN7_9PROT|nr:MULTISPECIES: HAD family hydrolase [Neokomagataea]GBR49498.1 histidinol phosphatase [Neokomagataea tanensis NBRC 106556]